MTDKMNNTVASAIEAGEKIATIEGRLTYFDKSNQDLVPLALVPTGYKFEVPTQLLAVMDARLPAPRRRRGVSAFTELDSFIAHVQRNKHANSVVFADVKTCQLTAIFNYSASGGDGAAGWSDHRAVYAAPLSRQWLLWTGKNEKDFSQDDFAQFIEDNERDLVSPVVDGKPLEGFASPAGLITMARHLEVRTNGQFSRKVNPTTGESELIVKDEREPSSTPIPKGFRIGIPIFEAGLRYPLDARIRFTCNGRPIFKYSLFEVDEVKRSVFAEIRERVIAATSLPLFAGAPEAPNS